MGVDEFRRHASSGGEKAHGHFDRDMSRQHQRVVAGSPKTVANAIARGAEETDSGIITGNLHAGSMPHWKTIKNLTLFAKEVIPLLRGTRDRRHRSRLWDRLTPPRPRRNDRVARSNHAGMRFARSGAFPRVSARYIIHRWSVLA
ncbi:MAG: hypothetical protein ACREQN_13180 [Candidatus Binataceae bacterium]